jgi:hypothetical protein
VSGVVIHVPKLDFQFSAAPHKSTPPSLPDSFRDRVW